MDRGNDRNNQVQPVTLHHVACNCGNSDFQFTSSSFCSHHVGLKFALVCISSEHLLPVPTVIFTTITGAALWCEGWWCNLYHKQLVVRCEGLRPVLGRLRGRIIPGERHNPCLCAFLPFDPWWFCFPFSFSFLFRMNFKFTLCMEFIGFVGEK